MRFLICTNNPRTLDELGASYDVHFVDGSDRDVFIYARNMIHKGHILLTHPLSGSVKPGETPYRSLLISQNKGDKVCEFSLTTIEECLNALKKFKMRQSHYSEQVLKDFQLIDWDIISSALPSALASQWPGH